MKIVKSLKESSLLIRGIIETIENEAKEQKGVFLSVLFGTIGASLLRNLLCKIMQNYSLGDHYKNEIIVLTCFR